MNQILLDTNFIITCIKQKIDFFENLKLMGAQVLIPKQVISEIKMIANSMKKLHFREDAKLSLVLLKKNPFKKIDLGLQDVDKGIKRFAKKNPKVIVATLDKELKDNIQNPKLVIRQKKKLEIV
jgi:rRNA-processing protein FCF1